MTRKINTSSYGKAGDEVTMYFGGTLSRNGINCHDGHVVIIANAFPVGLAVSLFVTITVLA